MSSPSEKTDARSDPRIIKIKWYKLMKRSKDNTEMKNDKILQSTILKICPKTFDNSYFAPYMNAYFEWLN